MTRRFGTCKFAHLRMISLSNTHSGRVIGRRALRGVTSTGSVFVSFKKKVGASRSLEVTFRDNTSLIAINDVTTAGPRLFGA